VIGAIIAKRRTRSAFDTFNRGDVSGFLANCAKDVIFVLPGSSLHGGRVEGKKALEEWLQKYLEHFSRVGTKVIFVPKNVCVQNIFALGGTNVIAVRYNAIYTNQEGKRIVRDTVWMIQAKKGKAVSICEYFDPELDRKIWEEYGK